MGYEEIEDEEWIVVTKAIELANLPSPRNTRERSDWACEIQRLAGVSSSNTKYLINESGRVVAHDDAKLSYRSAKPSYQQLVTALDWIAGKLTPESPTSIRIQKSADRKKIERVTINIRGAPELWLQRGFIHGNKVKPTTQHAITPTLPAFVAYSIALLNTKRWRTRLAKCKVCRSFFLARIRAGGPRPAKCRPECSREHKLRINREKQQRHRDRSKSLNNII